MLDSSFYAIDIREIDQDGHTITLKQLVDSSERQFCSSNDASCTLPIKKKWRKKFFEIFFDAEGLSFDLVTKFMKDNVNNKYDLSQENIGYIVRNYSICKLLIYDYAEKMCVSRNYCFIIKDSEKNRYRKVSYSFQDNSADGYVDYRYSKATIISSLIDSHYTIENLIKCKGSIN